MDGPLPRTKLSVAIAMLLATRFSGAADFIVDTTSDAVAVDGDISLREAIMASSGNTTVNDDLPPGDPDGDTIKFDPEVFTGTQAIVLSALGSLLITDDLIIDGSNGGSIVSIDGDAASRIFEVDTSEFVSISGLELFNGNAGSGPEDNGGALKLGGACDVMLSGINISGSFASNGGAIDSECARVTISNSTISGNTAGVNGGGAHANGGTISISNTTISGNSAAQEGGGMEGIDTSLDLTGGAISANSAGINGGGLHVTGASMSELTGLTIMSNTAGEEGGGLWNSAAATLTITNTTISGNTAGAANAQNDAQGGGGVFNNGGTISISNSTISNNHVSGDLADGDDGGGGIFNDGRQVMGARVELLDFTMVTNNEALGAGFDGGGILNIGAAGNDALLTASVGIQVMGNVATREGGGIESHDAMLSLSDVILSGNSAGINGGGLHVTDGALSELVDMAINSNTAGQEGGGLWNSAAATLTITNTTISGNTASAANSSDAQGGGGIFNNGGTVSLLGSSVTNNRVLGDLDSGDGGGGIFMDASNAVGGLVQLTESAVTDNLVIDESGAVPAGRGGGVMVLSGETSPATVSIQGGLIGTNQAEQTGGGVESDSSVVVLTGTTISGNSAGVDGGGVHTQSGHVLTITNSTISGNTANQEGGGLWNSAAGSMTINGSTISGNSASAQNSADDQGGGGVFNNGGTVSLLGSLIVDNVVVGLLDATDGGGGIFNDARNTDGATIMISDTDFMNNQVITTGPTPLAGLGGAAAILSDNSNSATVSVVGGLISGNAAPLGGGAFAVRAWAPIDRSPSLSGTTLSLRDTTIQGNVAIINGGAISLESLGAQASALIQSSNLIGNMAGNQGGAVWATGPQTSVDVDYSQIDGNMAPIGGGLFMDSLYEVGPDVLIQHSAIVRNEATDGSGGGIDAEFGTVSLINSTISNNSASINGGGLNVDASGVFDMQFVTVAENQAMADGGGLFNGTGGGIIDSGLFGLNQAANGPDILGTVMASFSLISDTSGTIVSGGIFNILDEDPAIGPLADNGGPTQTHALLMGSPAIDAGDNDGCPEFDQRGFTRPGQLCDIGAFDFDGFLDRFFFNGFEP